ncbi:MAG TPA: hypothetical protein VFZ61_20735, partial [Polyangiales bacterium]
APQGSEAAVQEAGASLDAGPLLDAVATADASVQDVDAGPPVPPDAQSDASDPCAIAPCPSFLGHSEVDEGWGEAAIQQDRLYLVPVVATRRVALRAFYFHVRETIAPAPGVCRFAIYDDRADQPHTLLTWSFVNAEAVNGLASVPAGSIGVRLVAGATYWVGVECFHPSASVRVRAKPLPEASVIQVAHTFGTDFPQTFPSTSERIVGTGLAVFVQVQDAPSLTAAP